MADEKIIDVLEIVCERCGETFVMSPAEQKFYNEHNLMIPKRCPECRKLRQQTEEFICKDCNAPFTISKLELEYYKEHDMHIPKRCKKCREFKRNYNKEDNK